MRCEDLTRELASPTGALPPAEMAGHLAACPACAERSRASARFDRIWEATRPSEPSMDALDALWARASAELDARKAPASIIPFERPNRRRRWAMAAFVTAQAAALLVAALVLLRFDRARPIDLADANLPGIAKPGQPDLKAGLDPLVVEVADAKAAGISEPVPLELVVELDEQAVVRLDTGNRPRVEKHIRSYDFASSLLPADTPHDEIGDMETAGSSWGTSVAIK